MKTENKDHNKAIKTVKQDHEKAMDTIQHDHNKALKTIRDDHKKAVAPEGFIKLTRHRSDRHEFTDLFIRPSVIESVCLGIDGFTIINGNRYYSVKETPEEIFKMLDDNKEKK